MEITNQILQLKKDLQTAETNKSNFEGKLSMLVTRLEEEFSINSFEKAEILLADKKQEIAELEIELQTKIKDFTERYPL